MKRDFKKDGLIKELEIRAEIAEKKYSDGWRFYSDICDRHKVSCLEEMTTSQLIEEVERLYNK